MNVQGTIIEEVRAALSGGAALSTTELVATCGTAQDTRSLSRILYVMRQKGMIEEDAVPGPPQRAGGPPCRRWRLACQTPSESIEDEAPGNTTTASSTHSTPEPVRHIPMEEVAEIIATKRGPIVHDRTDPTEVAMSDLVDQAEEALLALADSLLSDHPVWSRLRTLADDAHTALCDYLLMRSLEGSHE